MSMAFARRDPDTPGVESSYLSTAPGLITQAGVPTEAQFASIRERFGDPRASVRPEDYYVFRMIASGDGLDSYFTRQDVATSFVNFVRDLKKGQSVLGSHQMATFSYGSSYDGEVVPADEDRPEYEGTFYPQWDAPDLRTKNWLIGDYFIGRGISVNNQSQDDLVRAIELGTIRKASISFMVGQYQCGIDGKDLIPSMFGPMPDEECNHFPGISYDGQIAWALMKNNTLVETSLVYKNASPSSMLLRKAESLASRGVLTSKQIDTLEGRFQVRLPRFQPTLWTASTAGSSNANPVITSINTTPTTSFNPIHLVVDSSGTVHTWSADEQEDTDMANRPRSGDAATRDLVREALTAEEEPEQDETQVSSEAPEGADEAEPVAVDGSEHVDGGDGEAEADASTEAEPVAESEPTPDAEASDEETPDEEAPADDPDAVAAEADADADADDDSVDRDAESSEDRTTEESGEAVRDAAPETEEDAAETETESETTREEDAVATFVAAADRLAGSIARSPDAFDSGLLAMAARAEKSVDLALIDAGCDTTVGSQVARSFEIRSRKLNEALGQPMTVETIRSLQEKAKLGDELFAELVRDAVAARIGAQGDAAFNAQRYSDVLTSTRDVAYVKDEIVSWQSQKAGKFTSGRQVIPRAPVDVKPSAAERKTLPEPPALTSGKRPTEASSSSLIQPHKKK